MGTTLITSLAELWRKDTFTL